MPVEARISLNSHSLNHDCFVLPHWRSEEWNIQDDMEISPASVSPLSLSAMRALVPRSSTPSISTALGLRIHNSLTKAHPHGQGHAHSGTPRWQMELAERGERAMPWFDTVYWPDASCATVPWCEWKAANVFSCFFVAYEWRIRGYRWKRDLSLRLTSVPQGCEEVSCSWLLLNGLYCLFFFFPFLLSPTVMHFMSYQSEQPTSNGCNTPLPKFEQALWHMNTLAPC